MRGWNVMPNAYSFIFLSSFILKLRAAQYHRK